MNHSYTCVDSAGGSTGTENHGFHLQLGNTVTIQNGSIVVAPESIGIGILFQNSCDLTLKNLNLKGNDYTEYIISCNCGDTVVENVNIDGGYKAGELIAIDVMHWKGKYPTAPNLTLNNKESNFIKGRIDSYCYSGGYLPDCDDKPKFIINGGKYEQDPMSTKVSGYEFKGIKKLGDGLSLIEENGYFIVK